MPVNKDQPKASPPRGRPKRQLTQGELIYAMINRKVPAPFVKEQELALRDCTLEDIDNARKILAVQEGDLVFRRFLIYVSYEMRGSSRSRTMVQHFSLRDLEGLCDKLIKLTKNPDMKVPPDILRARGAV